MTCLPLSPRTQKVQFSLLAPKHVHCKESVERGSGRFPSKELRWRDRQAGRKWAITTKWGPWRADGPNHLRSQQLPLCIFTGCQVSQVCIHQVPALQAAVFGDQLKQDFRGDQGNTAHAKGDCGLRESQVLVTLSWLRFCPVLESGPLWGMTEAPPSGHHT